MFNKKTIILLAVACLVNACSEDISQPSIELLDNKSVAGWSSDAKYEIAGLITGRLEHQAKGRYAALLTARELQEELVDEQLKYVQLQVQEHGLLQSPLNEHLVINRVEPTAVDQVAIDYQARVELRTDLSRQRRLSLEDLSGRWLKISVPLDPLGNQERMQVVSLELIKIYPVNDIYPEYHLLDGQGSDGFRVALIVNRGDSDLLDRFNLQRQMLERGLNLVGEGTAEDAFIRYTWQEGAARMIVDLFNPARGEVDETFNRARGEYQLIFYQGRPDDRDLRFTGDATRPPRYQILFLHSCSSYPAYARRMFEAQTTKSDPRGFSLTDVLASSTSTSPLDAPRALQTLLSRLMSGVTAAQSADRTAAPAWNTILEQINDASAVRSYELAGVRDNVWRP